MPLDGTGYLANTETQETIATLRQAKAEIEKRGWCQKAVYQSATGNVCALGAIGFASDDVDVHPNGILVRAYNAAQMRTFTHTFDAARTAFDAVVPGGWTPSWNDTPGRTKEEVLAAFDRAIARLETGE